MLDNVNDIIVRVGALLDDPANTRFSPQYLIPHIDQQYDEMDVDLERLGMQYTRQIAVVNIAANISDLSYLLNDGQALQSMKLPVSMKWKIQGQDDVSYQPSDQVDELDEVSAGSQGAIEWTFQRGGLQVTPSAVALTLKIYFDAVSTNIYDPAQGVVRGTAHILSYRTAAFVASLNNGMGTLQAKLDAKANRSWTSFCNLCVQRQQSKQRSPRPIHRRNGPFGMPIIQAPQS